MSLDRHIDGCLECPFVEWLDEIAIRSGLSSPLLCLTIGMRSQIDDRYVVVSMNVLCDLDTVHRPGETDVHQHQIRAMFHDLPNGLIARAGNCRNRITEPA